MAGVFTEKQFDLLIEVTEVYRIPSVVKRAMKLYLVEEKQEKSPVTKGLWTLRTWKFILIVFERHIPCP